MLHERPGGGNARHYDPRMASLRDLHDSLGDLGRSGVRWSLGFSVSWWPVVYLGALVLVLSPSPYSRANRAALARHIVLGSAPSLPWFAMLSALVSVVLIRIVIVTAVS